MLGTRDSRGSVDNYSTPAMHMTIAVDLLYWNRTADLRGQWHMYCRAVWQSCDSGGVSDAMTKVLEARKALDDARAQASEMLARKRALLGLEMIRARANGRESQTTIAKEIGVGQQQVRAYEQAYRDWLRDHPGEQLA